MTTTQTQGRGPRPGTEPFVALDADAVAKLPWNALHGVEEAVTKVLWQAHGSLAGIMRIEPGDGLAPHAHPEAHHHMWVLGGSARVAERRVSAGSYVHVPAGMEHGVQDVGPEGFTMFYLYQLV